MVYSKSLEKEIIKLPPKFTERGSESSQSGCTLDRLAVAVKRTVRDLKDRIEQLEKINEELSFKLNQKGSGNQNKDELNIMQNPYSDLCQGVENQKVFNGFIELSRRIFSFLNCGAFLFDPDFTSLALLESDEYFLRKVKSLWDEGIISSVIAEGKPTVMSDPEEIEGKRGFVIIPWKIMTHSPGAFVFYTNKCEDLIPAQDLALLSLLVFQTARGVENSHLHRSLRQANNKLEESKLSLLHLERLAATGELARGIAHEINNPLQIISGKAELLEMKLKQRPETQSFNKELELIQENAHRISEIVKGLSDFVHTSQMEAKLSIDVNVRHLIHLLESLLKSRLAPKGIELRTKSEDKLPAVKGNPGELEQVFLNLILNASERMPGGGYLDIEIKRDGNWVCLDFKDSGPEIKDELLTQIFDPFFTTEGIKREHTARLFSSHTLVQKHKGSLEVKSTSEAGNVFTVKLPMV